MKSIWIKGTLAIAVLWVLAVGGMRLFSRSRVTAEDVGAYAAAHQLDDLAAERRTRAVDGFIAQINRLPFDERRKLYVDHRTQNFFEALNNEEKLRVFEETMPSGMTEVINSFNAMEEEQRREHVERALKDLERLERDLHREAERARWDPEERDNLRRMIEAVGREGLRAYLSEADAQSKIELQPVLEQLQAMMQRARW